VSTYLRDHALGLVIAALLVIVIALTFRGVDHGPLGSFATGEPAAGQDSLSTKPMRDCYPGCSFDGDFSNDKPGACPDTTKPQGGHQP
jgi:hypothetical protein